MLHAKRPTSSDVAAEAGVSRATVSYVLNGADAKHRITPATRDRVLQVAERLGYERNAVALALRAGRTEIVLVEMPNWPIGPPVAEAISTMVEALEQLGYTPLVHFQRADPQSLARASQRVHPVGVIAPGPELSPEVVARLHALGRAGLWLSTSGRCRTCTRTWSSRPESGGWPSSTSRIAATAACSR